MKISVSNNEKIINIANVRPRRLLRIPRVGGMNESTSRFKKLSLGSETLLLGHPRDFICFSHGRLNIFESLSILICMGSISIMSKNQFWFLGSWFSIFSLSFFVFVVCIYRQEQICSIVVRRQGLKWYKRVKCGKNLVTIVGAEWKIGIGLNCGQHNLYCSLSCCPQRGNMGFYVLF